MGVESSEYHGKGRTSWRDFWNRPNRIYVSERHRRVHYRKVADDILGLGVGPRDRVLDYGCGDAIEAQRVAASVAHLYLYDAADEVRRRLTQRFGGQEKITVLDPAALQTLPPGSIDLIVVNSVVQYLGRDEFGHLLGICHSLLPESGRLVLADIIPPGLGMSRDVQALLATAYREGFLPAALAGLFATFFSDYRQIRKQLKLSTYSAGELIRIADGHGFEAVREPLNLGFNPHRMTFTLRPATRAE